MRNTRIVVTARPAQGRTAARSGARPERSGLLHPSSRGTGEREHFGGKPFRDREARGTLKQRLEGFLLVDGNRVVNRRADSTRLQLANDAVPLAIERPHDEQVVRVAARPVRADR